MPDNVQVKKLIEKHKDSLLEILKNIEEEDQYIRQRMLRECKQLELYWHGFQYIFWDERVQDFRIPTHDVMEQVASREETKFIYDYVINILKAHGLSIIAALSNDVPGVSYSPFDSDNPKDTLAARRAELLGKVIGKKNRSKLIFFQALFTLYTNHFVASYNYFERDKDKYGTITIPKMGVIPGQDSYNCPNGDCNFTSENDLGNCPQCGNQLQLQEGEDDYGQIGSTDVDLGMSKIVVRGTLNVKIPTYAADQESCGYLIDYTDQHYTYLRSRYKDIIDRKEISLMGTDNFERIARMPSIGRLYSDTYLQALLTLKRVWLRPWMFEMLNDESDCEALQKDFPKGVCFHVIDKSTPTIAYIYEENLDDHWTIAKGDLSRAVHGDPLAKPLLPMQDLENMVGNLLTESLEHSVPSTFADTEMIDFELYSKQEVLPGAIYPTKGSLNPQRRMDDYFYTLKTSTLPKEGVDFERMIDNKGQFLIGAFPSINGGPQTEGSKTLGEYQESRNYALQRLSIPYQLLYFWWADTNYKSVKDYIANMVGDEKHSLQLSVGKFQTINLLMDDFKNGRFDLLLPESSIDLPVSFSQKRSMINGLMQLNSDTINGFLFSPENRGTTIRYLGIDDYDDLDSNQSMKQLLELEEMITIPIVIPIDPIIDDDEIHLRVMKVFLCSEVGQDYRKNNPEIYQAWMGHAEMHYNNLQQKLMAQSPPAPGPVQNKQIQNKQNLPVVNSPNGNGQGMIQ